MPANQPPQKEALPKESRAYHHGDLRRALVDAALALVTEDQNWSFSLREVARRAGVSHNAPYNHFGEKRDLLGAVAQRGFERLHERVTEAIAESDTAQAALEGAAHAYVGLALENPALYRLMVGPELAYNHGLPATDVHAVEEATRICVEDVIIRGAREGRFAVDPDDEGALSMVSLSCWAAIHGLVMLIIDGKAEKKAVHPPARLVEALMERLLFGLLAR